MRRRPSRATTTVALLFVANGVAAPSLLPRIPDLKDAVGASDATLGLALLGTGLGGMVGVALAPRLARRFRTDRVALASASATAAGILLVAAAPTTALLFVAFAVLGAVDGTADTTMNHLLFDRQRARGRSLASRMHALWSVGAVVGTGLGAVAAAAGVSLVAHVAVAATVSGALVIASAAAGAGGAAPPRTASPSGASPGPAGATSRTSDPSSGGDGGPPEPRGPAVPATAWALVAVAGVAATAVESVAQDWSALTLRDGLGASPALAGAGPTVFAIALLVGRLTGDRGIDRFGAAAVARAGGLAVAAGGGIGLGTAALFDAPALLLAGMAVAGVGAATLFPSMLAAGDRLDPSGRGVALASLAARVAFLVVPAVVGVVSDLAGLPVGYTVLPAAGLVVAVALPAALTGRRTGSPRDRPG